MSGSVHSAYTEWPPIQDNLHECHILQYELKCHISTPVKLSRLHVKEPPLCQLLREPIQSAHIFVSLMQPLRFWWTLPVISPPVWFSQSNPLPFVTFIPLTPISCLLFIKWSEESNYLQILLAGVRINSIARITFAGLQPIAIAVPPATRCGIIHDYICWSHGQYSVSSE